MQPYASKPFLLVVALFSALVTVVSALGSSCSAPLTKGNAGPNDPFWLQNIKHQGNATFLTSASKY